MKKIIALVLISVMTPPMVFGQTLDLKEIKRALETKGLEVDAGEIVEAQRVGRKERVLTEARMSEEALETKSANVTKAIIIQQLNKDKIPYIITAEGDIIVNPKGDKQAVIRDETTQIIDTKTGTILETFENSKVGKAYGGYVHFLFQYIIPTSIAYHAVKNMGFSALRPLLLNPFTLIVGGGYLTQTQLIDPYLKNRAKENVQKANEVAAQSKKTRAELEALRIQMLRREQSYARENNLSHEEFINRYLNEIRNNQSIKAKEQKLRELSNQYDRLSS